MLLGERFQKTLHSMQTEIGRMMRDLLKERLYIIVSQMNGFRIEHVC